MNLLPFGKLPPAKPRSFVPENIDLGDWPQIAPLFDQLETRAAQANSVEALEKWLLDWCELSAALDEEGSRRNIAMTCHTDNADAEKAYLYFVEHVEPQLKPRQFALEKLYVAVRAGLATDWEKEPARMRRYEVFDRDVKNHVELFRPENVALETEEAKLGQQYQKLIGAQTVNFRGEEKTLVQMGRFLEEPDRALRQEAWELVAKRRLQDSDKCEEIMDELIKLRHQIAKNAGFNNYLEYIFRQKCRFDYTPADCVKFHDAIESEIMPAVREIQADRRRQLKLETLRPWDLAVDPQNRPPLKPFAEVGEMVSRTQKIFNQLDAGLAANFQEMQNLKLLDLDNRKGKAPGGYQSTLSEARVPFIFMNAVGVQRDVETILHEAGHAFHAQATRGEDLYPYRSAPIEFCEVASMAMELLGGEFLEEFYPVVGQASSLSSSGEERTGGTPEQTGKMPVPLPFTPFDHRQPASIRSRHLPHWQQDGVTYFVTFRLADSLPKEVLASWRQERESAIKAGQQPQEAINEKFRDELEIQLDKAHGACHLKNPAVAEIIEQALRHFDGQRYLLGSYVIMPNHVHVLVRPVMGHKLSEILHSWKSFTTKEANKILGRMGGFWQDESFDHIVRDEQCLEKFGRYIQENPLKAGLPANQFRLGVGQASSLSSSGEERTGGTPVPLRSAEANRARKTHLEGIIGFFPWMATVDAFQHWIYTHPDHSRAERKAAYLQLMDRFGGDVDFTGFEEVRVYSWHRQLHIFLYPFYYVEYGIAQLGALQVWANSKANKAKALNDYKKSLALGGSRPLPELFAAAGCKFDFSAQTIQPLIQLAGSELKKF